MWSQTEVLIKLSSCAEMSLNNSLNNIIFFFFCSANVHKTDAFSQNEQNNSECYALLKTKTQTFNSSFWTLGLFSIERQVATTEIKLLSQPLPPLMATEYNSPATQPPVIYKSPLFCCLGASLVSSCQRLWARIVAIKQSKEKHHRFHKLHPAT